MRRVAALLVGWTCVSIGAICLLARNIVLTNHFWVVAACAVPYAFLAGLLAAGAFATTRRRLSLAFVIVLFASLGAPQIKVLLTRPPEPTQPTMTVMTLNMRLGAADASRIVAAVESQHVNVLMLQELTPAALGHLRSAGLARSLSFRYVLPEPAASGVGIFSSYPMSNPRSYSGFANHVVSSTLTLPDGQRLTAFSSHLSAPWPQNPSDWAAESTRLASIVAATPSPLIDAGDFNSTSNFRAFRQVLEVGHVADAAAEAGAATLRTFPADSSWIPPLIGIDHVLVRGPRSSKVDTLRITGSDHRAVLVHLDVTNVAAS